MAPSTFHSKLSGSMGDGSHTHTIPRNDIEHEADLILFCMRDKTHIGKSRYGITGDVTPDQFMDILLKHFSRLVYNDIAVVFQEGLFLEMKKAIGNVLDEHMLTKEISNDTFRRESS